MSINDMVTDEMLQQFSDDDLDILMKAEQTQDPKFLDMLSKQGQEVLYMRRPFSAERMVKNIPGDASKFFNETKDALLHPVDTAKGLYGEVVDNKGANLIAGIKNKYGSLDRVVSTLETEPVHTFSDLASILYPAAGVSRIAGAGRLGEGLSSIAGIVDPVSNAVRIAKVGAKVATGLLPEDTASRIFRSATKVHDPLMADEMMRRGINPLRAEDVSAVKGQKSITGQAIGNIVNDNDRAIKASELFNGVMDRYHALDDPSISAGTEGIGYQNWVRKFANHVGYTPDLNDRPLRKFLGIPDQPPASTILGPDGAKMPTTQDWARGNDPNVGLKSIWEMRIGADSKHFTKQGALKDPLVGPASGRMAAERQVTDNARKIVHRELDQTPYAALAREYGALDNIVTNAEDAFTRYSKTDDPFRFHSLMPVGGGAAAGYALGGPKLATVGALGALAIGSVLNPKRKAQFGIFTNKYRNMPIGKVLDAPVTAASPIADVLARIQEEKDHQRMMRTYGIGQ